MDLIQEACDKITFCTLELYNRIIKDLPPTPSKFHYIFNLRDLSRVYSGLTLTKPDRSDEEHLTLKLVVYVSKCLISL